MREDEEITVEELITKHGESNRKLITDAITWLEKEGPNWVLPTPIDQGQFIHNLIQQRAKS